MAFVVDVYAQRIVGWQAASTKVTDLVLTPLRIALWDRDRQGTPVEPGQLLHHSDAGSQYTSIRFTEHLELEGIAPSIGSVGDAYDNAVMESIIGLFKTEAITTPAPTRPSPTSSTRPPAGSTGTTIDACTDPSAGSPQSSTSRTTTLPPTESRNPHSLGREPVTVH